MKKTIFIIAAWIILGYACSDDEGSIPQISGIVHSTFLDERDSTVYQCITVNGQTWLAENLRYRLPTGASEGCYTWEEAAATVTTDDFATAVSEAYSSGELVDPMPIPITGSMRVQTRSLQMGFITKEEFMAYYADYPETVAALEEIDTGLLPNAVASAFAAAEASNGYYSEHFGFLYTYEAAQNALPEGWRLPTDEDWKALEEALGMSNGEANQSEAWRGEFEGLLLKEGTEGIGFNAKMGGGLLYGGVAYGSRFQNENAYAYFWTGTTQTMNDSIPVAYIRKLNYVENRIFRGTSPTSTPAYSVRAIME